MPTGIEMTYIHIFAVRERAMVVYPKLSKCLKIYRNMGGMTKVFLTAFLYILTKDRELIVPGNGHGETESLERL